MALIALSSARKITAATAHAPRSLEGVTCLIVAGVIPGLSDACSVCSVCWRAALERLAIPGHRADQARARREQGARARAAPVLAAAARGGPRLVVDRFRPSRAA